jgi:hypothetical protein
MRGLYLLLLALATGPAAARVYQWVDPDTRNVYLSGSPPAWYRTAAPGPRVLVFDNDRLVDDTGIEATEEQARDLRERALSEEALRQQQAAEAGAAEAGDGTQTPETDAEDAGEDARTKAEMRALVEQYLKSVLVEKLPLLLGGPSAPEGPGAAPAP